MCGVSGGFQYSPGCQPIDREQVGRLNELLRNRGPDGEGLWSSQDGRIVLGHRRLAIIETGPAGSQPMLDSTGRWIISFNGEIYNYQQLRLELEALGCKFRTNSDTEVLINVVAYWGETGLLRLRGMYAFALWDSRKRELWLVRDPLGIKPLYWTEIDGTLWFASQARALAEIADQRSKLEPAALVGFYQWGFVPEPYSWWSNVHLLEAGHLLRVRDGLPVPKSFQFAAIQDAFTNRLSARLSPNELHDILLDSVRHHLVSDVPVGLFLSSGINSTALAGLARKLTPRLQSITLTFEEFEGSADDEGPLAERRAKLLNLNHTTARITRRDFEKIFNDFVASMDQPTTDGLNTYLISSAAARHGLKVVLSGLGGDELFGGYPSFAQIPKLVLWGRRTPGHDEFGKAVKEVALFLLGKDRLPKLPWLHFYSRDVPHAYFLRRVLHLDSDLEAILDESTLREGIERLASIGALANAAKDLIDANTSDYAQVAVLESSWYMRNQLLRDSDWASMRFGLEIRVPYVDWATICRLGSAIASKTPPTKVDLAKCAGELASVDSLRPKTGFNTPINRWLAEMTGVSRRGLQGWAEYIGQEFSSCRLGESKGALTMPNARRSFAERV